MKKYLILLPIILVFVAIVLAVVTQEGEVYAVDVIIEPVSTEPIIDFDCSNLPCVILGTRVNNAGVELKQVEYNFVIQNAKVNNQNNVGFVVNKGDRVFLNAYEQDRPDYYIFLSQLDISHQFVSDQNFLLAIETSDVQRGDYQIVIQDSFDPEIANVNLEAGVLRVQ